MSDEGIVFGDFRIDWSGGTSGKGHIYYDHAAGESLYANSIRICVTDLKSIEGIDATDDRWKYKTTPAE